MKNVLYALVVTAVLLPVPATANPTGAPLFTYPVEPCRFMDTRVGPGPLLPDLYAMDGWVRGSKLQASNGATTTDCGVPPEAESVRMNITVLAPSGSSGHLRINGTGWLHQSTFSRINYSSGQTIANEIEVSLCNTYFFPTPQTPCPYDGMGRYLDFQMRNYGTGPVHIVGDVVGYLARP